LISVSLIDKNFGALQRFGPCYELSDKHISIYFKLENLRESYYLLSAGSSCEADRNKEEGTVNTYIIYLNDGIIYSVNWNQKLLENWESDLNIFSKWRPDIEDEENKKGKKEIFYYSTKGMKRFFNEEMYSNARVGKAMYSFGGKFNGEDLLSVDEVIAAAEKQKEAIAIKKRQESEIISQLERNRKLETEVNKERDFYRKYIKGTLWYVKGTFIDDKVIIIASNYVTKRVTVQDPETGKIFDAYAENLITTGQKNMKNLGRGLKLLCAFDPECRNK
jgi:hypothetical protein